MPWGDKQGGNDNGPWGKPPVTGGGGGNKGGNTPQGPDFDEWFKRGQDSLKQLFPGHDGDGAKGILLLCIIVLLLWLSSGIYFVRADEQGVVLRFGKYTRTTAPGLNYHLPYPVETVETPRVTAINHVEIGYRSSSSRSGQMGESTNAGESLMLTGDENIVDIDFEVQWKINNAPDFLFNIRNPEETVKAISESAMREVIGKSKIADVLAEGKLIVAQDTRKLIQNTLDSYKAGIEVVTVNLLKADPPAEVLDAQRDVQTALADAETVRNQAEAYHNDIVPRARGQAQQIELEAGGYKEAVIARAQGEASRFSAVYSEYVQAKDVTRKRMYLETMEDILQGMTKIVVNKGGSGVVPYLPLPELKSKPEEPTK